jgi:prevent-host-death family protein
VGGIQFSQPENRVKVEIIYNVDMFLHWSGMMAITTLSSREFNQDAGRAKKAAVLGPVFITDRGRPSHVLLSIEEYEKITGKGESIADLLAMANAEDVEFEPARMSGDLHRPVDLP